MSVTQERSYCTEGQSTWILYDLQDPEGRQQARKDLQAWGKDHASVYPVGLDHVFVVLHPGIRRSAS